MPKILRAIGYNGQDFVCFKEKMAPLKDRDLLIEVKAVSINPIDSKIKKTLKNTPNRAKILGFDGAGIVKDIGKKVKLFKTGDEVYYAGDINRDGSNANLQLLDERICGHKPKSFSFAKAVAMPLCAITAWESLFERLAIDTHQDKGKTILLIGAAGGVGSIAIQLAKSVANLTVIATASRNNSKDWCRKMGADVVIEHKNLLEQFLKHKLNPPDFILCMGVPDDYMQAMLEVIKPQGCICLLANFNNLYDLNLLKSKSIKLAWEMMFTKPMYQTDDMIEQHNILNKIANLIDNKQILSILNKSISPINIENIIKAHNIIEKGDMIGKLTIVND